MAYYKIPQDEVILIPSIEYIKAVGNRGGETVVEVTDTFVPSAFGITSSQELSSTSGWSNGVAGQTQWNLEESRILESNRRVFAKIVEFYPSLMALRLGGEPSLYVTYIRKVRGDIEAQYPEAAAVFDELIAAAESAFSYWGPEQEVYNATWFRQYQSDVTLPSIPFPDTAVIDLGSFAGDATFYFDGSGVADGDEDGDKLCTLRVNGTELYSVSTIPTGDFVFSTLTGNDLIELDYIVGDSGNQFEFIFLSISGV